MSLWQPLQALTSGTGAGLCPEPLAAPSPKEHLPWPARRTARLCSARNGGTVASSPACAQGSRTGLASRASSCGWRLRCSASRAPASWPTWSPGCSCPTPPVATELSRSAIPAHTPAMMRPCPRCGRCRGGLYDARAMADAPWAMVRQVARGTSLPQCRSGDARVRREGVDLLPLGLGQLPSQGSGVGPHLLRLGGARDHRCGHRRRGEPADRQLEQGVPALPREVLQLIDDGEVVVVEVALRARRRLAQARARRWRSSPGVLAGEHPGGQREVREDAHAVGAAGVDDAVLLWLAVQQRPVVLHAGKSRDT